jgi:DNA primase
MSGGRIPNEVIEAILKMTDIVDVVGRYVHLTKQGHYMKGLCPFHSEKTPSFTVTPEKQIYKCYGCGAGGSAVQFLMGVEGYSFVEAVRELAKETGVPLGIDENAAFGEQQENTEKAALYKAYELTGKFYHYLLMNTAEGKKALEYLRSRGMTDKLIDTFQIGYAPLMWDFLAKQLEKREFDLKLMEKGGLVRTKQGGSGYNDLFHDRVMFPICDPKGRIIAFAGRAMGEVQPKYLNSPETMLFNKSRQLFNFHMARPHIRKSQQLVLFEGYMDVIKAWEAGVENGVATMGTSLTPDHAKIIRSNAERVNICYDGDSAGQAAAFKGIPILEKAGCEVKISLLPDKLDPDEYVSSYGPDRFMREIIQGAVPSIKYKLLYTRRNFRLQEEGENLRYMKSALTLIAEIVSPIEREHYVKELAGEFGITFESLWQNLNQIRGQLEKKKNTGDNNDNPWNNVMNNGPVKVKTPTLFPAYHNAEQKLLAVMMHDRDVSRYVEQRLGDQFHVETHEALAAYLYSYYAQGNEPNVSAYVTLLEDEQLSGAATFIADLGVDHATSEKVIDDYIQQIKRHYLQEEIKRLKEDQVRAVRSGDDLQAAQIGLQMITLDKQLKS